MSGYHRLPIAQKRAAAIASARESAVACPDCDTQVMPADLLAHLEERCTGPRDPGPGSQWITWREARSLVPKRTLVRWIDSGRIRFKGDRGDRQYLLRDLVKNVARRRLDRRR